MLVLGLGDSSLNSSQFRIRPTVNSEDQLLSLSILSSASWIETEQRYFCHHMATSDLWHVLPQVTLPRNEEIYLKQSTEKISYTAIPYNTSLVSADVWIYTTVNY